MVWLRRRVSVLCGFAWSGSLLLAGCAETVAPRLPSPVAHQVVVATTGSIANIDAELVMARAIAEHEMRRP
jgi:hypothetical protein